MVSREPVTTWVSPTYSRNMPRVAELAVASAAASAKPRDHEESVVGELGALVPLPDPPVWPVRT